MIINSYNFVSVLGDVNAYNNANALSPLGEFNADSTNIIYTSNATKESVLDNGQYVLKVTATGAGSAYMWVYFSNLSRYRSYRFTFDVKSSNRTTVQAWIPQTFWTSNLEYQAFSPVGTDWTTFSVDVQSLANSSEGIWFDIGSTASDAVGDEMYFRNFKMLEILNADLTPQLKAWSVNEGNALPDFNDSDGQTVEIETTDVFNSTYAVKITQNNTDTYKNVEHNFTIVEGQKYAFLLIYKCISTGEMTITNRSPWSKYGLTSIVLTTDGAWHTVKWTQTAFASGNAELWFYTSREVSNAGGVLIIDTLTIKPVNAVV